MEIPSKYDPTTTEDKWYAYWLKNDFFSSTPDDREPYTIVIPPPNVTGVLHMGHMLNNTLQDVLVRRARMLGKNACWVPGTDHASIATEAKVVAKLKEQGIDKNDLTREEFLEHAWEWTHKHGGIILEQLKKLGASCDWNRTSFTMDTERSESVIKVFVDLYNKGLIFKGYRMVNWDTQAQTTVSDEEVIHKDVQSKLYYLSYPIEGSDEKVIIATTRPETILGDTALCIHPEDERFSHLAGKRALVPIANRSIPIIQDTYVDMEFGTGCLKITPAHDVNDKEIGDKHELEIIDILNDDGSLNDLGLHYSGQDRFAARKNIAKELKEKGFLIKIEDYATSVGTSERTGAVIEPKLSEQWFLKMKDLSEPALKAVMEDQVKLIPEKFKNTYRHWMENVRDWSISRQLWWGHQIPAWHYGEEKMVVAETEAEALTLAREESGNPNLSLLDLTRDPDALDTWFSSWLWPISVFDGIRNPENPEINYYYPTQDLVTAPEILFFWVARMIIAGYEYRDQKPFENVYLTGIVRDKQGRKMSKSLGNSPDPISLMEQYGADGVRVGMLLTSPAGNDLPFDEELCLQGRNFANKIWNAFRLTRGWEVDSSLETPAAAALAMDWFENRLAEALVDIDDKYQKYRISEALMATYKLVWDDFCSWYLEMVKPDYQHPIDSHTYQRTEVFFEKLLGILHPFMPFQTEEIWHLMAKRKEGESIMHLSWPTLEVKTPSVLTDFEMASDLITQVRNFRAQKGLSPREALTLMVKGNEAIPMEKVVVKLANIDEIEIIDAAPEQAFSLLVKQREFFLPASQSVNMEEEILKLQKELEYTQGFLRSVQKKLSNERFVSGAPEAVVANERKKEADAAEKLIILKDQIKQLQG